MADARTSRHVSPWVDTVPQPQLPATRLQDVTPDVLVIGGGIVGITTALLLQRAGRRACVVEARDLSHSVTAHSTVKVTVGHGTLYSEIEEKQGFEAAKIYAEANVAGFEQILELVNALDIECMLEHGDPHVVYAEKPAERQKVEREADVVGRLGLPASMSQDAPVPFDVAAALHFHGQAQFHPVRYLSGLAEALVRDGGAVVRGVRALGVEEDDDTCHIQTTAGTVSAPHVVVATQFPILDRGGHFAWLEASRSYGVAGVLPAGTSAGMAINVGSPTHSTRTANLGGDELLIVVGEGHEVGHVSDTTQRWERLREWATERFGVSEFRYHWSAEETSTLDKIPFAGFIAPGSDRILTAAGFNGWGMTNGTASALMLRDLILGQDNPWVRVFDARRAESTIPGREFVKHNIQVGKTWLKDRLGGAKGTADDLGPGEAGIVDVAGKKSAAYRDEQGVLHAVSPVCTHLGCDVEWNDGERSWDCPCHGSRFSCDGEVLHGPATTPLGKRDAQD